MEILRKDDGRKGKFYVEQEGRQLAEMTYVWAGTGRIIIDHTEVDEALKGQNAGRQMVASAVNFAREAKIRILPLCPFAKSVFDKTPEYADVLS